MEVIESQPPSGASAETHVAPLSLAEASIDSSELRRIRRAIASIMLVLVLFIGARLWCLEGLLFPVSIVGASMADTFAGPHFRVTCEDCGHIFRCDATAVPSSQEMTCPNCGYARTALKPAEYRPGEQVLIDRWVLLLARPQRGDVVAFTHPDDDAQRVVKRIVGLPGEQVAIRRGDVIIDGRRATKSLAQLRAEAILVHDSRLPPRKTKDIPAHWQPNAGSHWTEREHAYIFDGKVPPPGERFNWLSFRYFRRRESPQPRFAYSPVLDDDAYNQASNRQLNEVSDLLLTCRANIAKYGCLVFAAVDGADRFEVHLCHDESKLKLFQNGKELRVELLPHRKHDEPIDIDFALCDQRVLFGMDGREVLAQSYTRSKPDAPQIEPQLQIGGAGARIRISQAIVYRDIYYLEPLGTARSWHAERTIPPQHYLVLGDNPPVSTDSRQWPQAEVPQAAILGRVIRPWWARAD